MSWIWEQLFGLWNLFWLVTFLVILASPFETLGWWAGWKRKPQEPPPGPSPEAESEGPFLVYLTGVAGFSGDFLSRRELGFLDRMRQRLPQASIVQDVFPFSANNNPLDGDRLFRWLWVWLHRWRLKMPNNVFDVLIIVRNVAQTLVSADPRYGPVYNQGVARELANSLRRQGYAEGRALHLVCYSGGAQIAIGAAPYLKEILNSPIQVLSLGGVITDDPGMQAVDQLIDFKGSRDHIMPTLGWLLFPGRWRPLFFSPWNRMRRQGRISFRVAGPMAHIGGSDYFSRKATVADGRCYGEVSADLVVESIADFQAKLT